MTKKNLVFNTAESNLYENLLIAKEILPKSFVRRVWIDNVSIKIMDDFRSVTDLYIKTKGKKKLTKKEIKVLKKNNIPKKKEKEKLYEKGQAFKLDKHVLRHKKWNALQIEVPLIPNVKSKSLVTNYATKLSFFKKKAKVWSTKLTPEKGGYTVRSFGILGFLNAKQALIASISERKGKKENSYFSGINRLKLKIGQRIPFLKKKTKWRFLRKNHWKTKRYWRWLKARKENHKKWKEIKLDRKRKKLEKLPKGRQKSIKSRKKKKKEEREIKWKKSLKKVKLELIRTKHEKNIKLGKATKVLDAEKNPKNIYFYQSAIKRILGLEPNTKDSKVNLEINRIFTFKTNTIDDNETWSYDLNGKQENLIQLVSTYENVFLTKDLSKKKDKQLKFEEKISFKLKERELKIKEAKLLKKIQKAKLLKKIDNKKKPRSVTKQQKFEKKVEIKMLKYIKRKRASLKSPFIFYSEETLEI